MTGFKDRRSPEASAYRALYKSKAWKMGRLIHLTHNPLCTRCQLYGIVKAATVVHHRRPHRGDIVRFFDQTNWESLCFSCHDTEGQAEDRNGYSGAIGQDGWPLDTRHPANR